MGNTRASSRDVAELHSSLFRFKCSVEETSIAYVDPLDDDPVAIEALERGERPDVPLCPRCGALVRPGVVWFEETLSADSYLCAQDATRTCDVCFVIGTFALVWPAARLPLLAHAHGALLVVVNPEPTDLNGRADLAARGPAGVMLLRPV